MTTTEQKEQEKYVEKKQSPETIIEVDKWLSTEKTKVDTEIDAKKLEVTVDEKTLTEEQLADKKELEKDLSSGIKVSEAVGKWSTRLDTMDKWLSILPFVDDAFTSSAWLLFFIAQNQRLSKKYRLPLADKLKAMLLQVWDWTLETLVKAPLNTLQAIPVLWWLTWPITQPIKMAVWYVIDWVFKANKWTAKLFKNSFEQMLADAETWNKENPNKEQIDVVGMKDEIEENMKKITTTLSYKDKVKKETPSKDKEEKKEI